MFDVVIIGAGVTGSAVARYLSRYRLSICVLEKAEDVCCGTSKANSAIVHAGFDAAAGSLMAKYNVLGSRMMEPLSRELDFDYIRNGSLVVCTAEEDMPKLRALYENGVRNGVERLEIIGRDRLKELEPNIADGAIAALWAPTGAIVCPFGLNIALAENACANGVEFRFNTEVLGFTRTDPGWTVATSRGDVEARLVVNAAGIYSDVLHNMVSAKKLHITPRRGDYLLLDRSTAGTVTHTVFQLPGKLGKGVLVTPTVHGNTLVGPTAVDVENRQGTATTAAGLETVQKLAGIAVSNVPFRQVITSFAGLRAHEDGHEFVLGVPEDAPFFYDCAGIESPGLSACPAIGEATADAIAALLSAEKNPDFQPKRTGILRPKALSAEEYAALIRKEPAYGQIICRCETVTEGEILDAIRRPLGAKSLDGVKRRVRAGMGRCQGGFCSPRVMELLARELGVPQSEITKSGGSSALITGINNHREDSV